MEHYYMRKQSLDTNKMLCLLSDICMLRSILDLRLQAYMTNCEPIDLFIDTP